MKTKTLIRLIAPLALLSTLKTQLSASPLGTAFTYQGRLTSGTNAANGIFDLRFAIYDAASGPAQVGNALTNAATGVTNGYFTVTLNFGSVFDGNARWLEIGVRTNGGGAFTPLTPRQPLTPAPYAIFANTASNLSGTLPASQLSGTLASAQLAGTYSSAVAFNNAANSFTGNGSGLTSLNANNLGSGTVPDARLAANVARLNPARFFPAIWPRAA